jgi:hypothetical protein
LHCVPSGICIGPLDAEHPAAAVRASASSKVFAVAFISLLLISRHGLAFDALARSFFRLLRQPVAIFPKPRPSARVSLQEGLVMFVAQKHADLVHAEIEKIVYPAVLADIPAAFTRERGSVAGLHRH